MACLLVAAWTWVIAAVSLSERPGWALVIAAIGGFSAGIQLMIAVYESQRDKTVRKPQVHHGGRLRIVRAASGA
jgi:hypothetical protein